MERLGYRPWLDGLRGIAISLVFVNHLQFFIYQGGPLFGWLLLPFGALGVDVFFVLSGFLITTLLLEEHDSKSQIGLKNFYIRRALRLLPALLFLLLGVLLYSHNFMASEDANSAARLSVIAIFYCTNWFFAFGGNSDLLGHLWSLAVEEQFILYGRWRFRCYFVRDCPNAPCCCLRYCWSRSSARIACGSHRQQLPFEFTLAQIQEPTRS